MRKIWPIWLALLILTSCQFNRMRFELLPDVVLQENPKKPFNQPPLYVKAINDSIVYFLYEFESVTIWNINTGKQVGNLIPLMNIPKFLKEEINRSDTIEMIDLTKVNYEFYKTYPFYYLHYAYINNGYCKIIALINNPIITRGVINIRQIPLLLTLKLNGEVINKEFIRLDSNVLITPNAGCIIFPEQKKFITSAFNLNIYKVLTAEYQLSDSQYIMGKVTEFPQFLDSIRNMMVQFDRDYQMIANCDFRQVGKDIWFLNNRDIYDYKTGKLIVTAKTTPTDDTIRFIRSFEVINDRKGNPRYVAYLESTYPDVILEFTTLADENNLMIRDLKKNKIIKKFRLGNKISGLTRIGNQLIWIEESGENYYFKRLKFKL